MEWFILFVSATGFLITQHIRVKRNIKRRIEAEFKELLHLGLDPMMARNIMHMRIHFRYVPKAKKPDCFRKLLQKGRECNMDEKTVRFLMKYDGP